MTQRILLSNVMPKNTAQLSSRRRGCGPPEPGRFGLSAAGEKDPGIPARFSLSIPTCKDLAWHDLTGWNQAAEGFEGLCVTASLLFSTTGYLLPASYCLHTLAAV